MTQTYQPNYEGPADDLAHLPDPQTIPMRVDEFILGMVDEVLLPGRIKPGLLVKEFIRAGDRIRGAATELITDVFTTATDADEIRRRLIAGTHRIADDYRAQWPEHLALVTA